MIRVRVRIRGRISDGVSVSVRVGVRVRVSRLGRAWLELELCCDPLVSRVEDLRGSG